MKALMTIFEKLETGIEGLDQISYGGLPKGRATLVGGTAGSAKTVLAAQFSCYSETRTIFASRVFKGHGRNFSCYGAQERRSGARTRFKSSTEKNVGS